MLVHALLSTGTLKHHRKMVKDRGLNTMDIQFPIDNNNDIQTHVLHKPSSPRARMSPAPCAIQKQSPFATLYSTSHSKEWLLDSGVKPESIEQPRKLRRLRKLGDHEMKFSSQSEKQMGLKINFQTSEGVGGHEPTKLAKGKKKRSTGAAVYIEEEAEVSSEGGASDNDEEEHVSSSYEDSFIDDGVNPTSVGTQAGASRPDMMGIYRRSLLSQSPFQIVARRFSPDSAVQSDRVDENGSSSSPINNATPQMCLQSTDRIRYDESAAVMDSHRRKLSYDQARSMPMVNLNEEFSKISVNAGKENASMQIAKTDRTEDGNNIDIFDDDGFYEGLDLDAIEAEATRLLEMNAERSSVKGKTRLDVVEEKLSAMESPSFDLGI